MSRKDEIEDKAIDFRHSILYLKSARDMVVAYKSFKSGANWADSTMLDKVCDWLKENVEYAVMKKNGKHTIELAGIEELAEDLQKDMRI